MDNPAHFVVLWRAEDTEWDLTSTGLLGSMAAARDAAAKHLANTDVPDMEFTVAVVTVLDQDPATGTPLGHLNPPNALGYALASLTAPGHRSIDHTIHDLDTARALAESQRARSQRRGDGAVFDVVALTISDHTNPDGAITKEAATR